LPIQEVRRGELVAQVFRPEAFVPQRLFCAEREEILGAFDGFLEPAQQLL
jgi:hypothetical protein